MFLELDRMNGLAQQLAMKNAVLDPLTLLLRA